MNILLISPWYPNHVHKQDGNFVRAQAELLAEQHTVEVLCVVQEQEKGARPQVQREVEKGGVAVIRSSYSGKGNRIQRLLRRRTAWKAALAQRSLTPDLIHAHVLIDGGIVAHRLAEELGIPFVVTEHSHRWLEGWPILRRPELWLAKRAARAATAVVAVSPSLAQGMRNHGIPHDIRVIPNVIDTALFYPEERMKRQGFTFLHVSDFSPNKNVADILHAFAEVTADHPDARLHIAGNGDRRALDALSRTLHLRPRQITISGPHAPAEVAQLMRSSDAFILNSSLETQSLVVIEALLSGLPVISTRSGGPADIITSPERGILIPTNNKSALTEAMSTLLKDEVASPYSERLLRHQNGIAEFGHVGLTLGELYKDVLNH